MKKFIIKTLGCKTNQAESALIAEILENNGFKETETIDDADYYILNSCSVTHIADTKNLYYLKRAKRENPDIKTVITGCMAQLEKENLLKNNIADFVIGNFEKNDTADILLSSEKCRVSNIFSHDTFRHEKLHQTQRTRAVVKIQDGCDNRCAYCTIPYARGKNRSAFVQDIIEQINLFASENYFETVLTGIHIGQWGKDFTPKKSLKYLLEKIEKSNIKRYRLGSLNPLELSDEFIDFLSLSTKFCPHFHLSLQSFCDKTLKNMNRHYTFNDIKHLINYINSKFENAFIGCDIITGFPCETIEDFETSCANAMSLNLTKIHVFPFSCRKGTPAAVMPEQVQECEKKRRVKIIKKISDEKLEMFLRKNILTNNEVIIEKNRDKKTNLLKGVTKNYINVLIDNEDFYKNTVQKARLKGITPQADKMFAEIIEHQI